MRVNARKTPRHLGGKLYVFGSAHEAQVCTDLWLEQKAGEISRLQFHPKFIFFVQGIKIGHYTADASFLDRQDVLHVIDAKGFKKSAKTGKLLPRVDKGFSMRKALMMACFGIEVEIR